MTLLARFPVQAPALAALLLALPAAASAEEITRLASANGSQLDERLPSGDGAEWRKRLTDWSHAPDEQVRIAESVAATGEPPRGAGRLVISSGYGWRSDPLGAGQRLHAGIDLPGKPGSAVYATGEGVVSFAGWASGYGNLVQIDHPGGLRTRYGHLSKILVRPGIKVMQGDVVGRMGSTGRSTGSHLHYEVRVRGVPANPLGFMGTSAGSIADYQVEWPQQKDVVPRWTGWGQQDHSKLPEAHIR